MRFPFIRKSATQPPSRYGDQQPKQVPTADFVKLALDPEAKKKADSIFRKAFTAHIVKPMAELGFKRHGSSEVARVVGDGLYQYVVLGKSRMMNKSFNACVGLRPLYIPDEFLPMRPGASLGELARVGDRSWEYWTEEQGERHFPQVVEMIERFGLPWFEEHQSTQDLLRAWDHEDQTVRGSGGHWQTRDHAFMILRVGKLDLAREEFEKAQRLFREDGRDWALAAADECDEHLAAIKKGPDEVDSHLRRIESAMREKWKLVDW